MDIFPGVRYCDLYQNVSSILNFIKHDHMQDKYSCGRSCASGFRHTNLHLAVLDLRRVQGRRAPPWGQNFFIFMQFSGKIGQIIGRRPPQGLAHPFREILDPPLSCEYKHYFQSITQESSQID